MKQVIKWLYRIALIPPTLWFISSIFYYAWVVFVFGKIPSNDFLYGKINSIVLHLILDLGTFVFIGFMLSSLFIFVISPVHLLLNKLLKKNALNFNWKHDGVIRLIVSFIFGLNFIPNINIPFDAFLSFLID